MGENVQENPVERLNNRAALTVEAETGAALDVVTVETEDVSGYDNKRKHGGLDH